MGVFFKPVKIKNPEKNPLMGTHLVNVRGRWYTSIRGKLYVEMKGKRR